jgi:hypothetical protein
MSNPVLNISTTRNADEVNLGDAALSDTLVSLLQHEDEKTARKAAQAKARAERAAARAAARAIPPECDDAYEHLALAALRSHRQDVAEAEERLGYWQRIAMTRLEALRGESADLDMVRMRPALVAGGLAESHSKVERTLPGALPATPDLLPLFVELDAPGAPEALNAVAASIGGYREALASLTKAATRELIARYRLAPTECLNVLPLTA